MSEFIPLRRGTHAALENEANRLIRESLQGVTKHSEKSDILTPWKEAERHRREVYVASGTPDASTRRGIFYRSTNPTRPELNSRAGICRPRRSMAQGLANFVAGNPEGEE